MLSLPLIPFPTSRPSHRLLKKAEKERRNEPVLCKQLKNSLLQNSSRWNKTEKKKRWGRGREMHSWQKWLKHHTSSTCYLSRCLWLHMTANKSVIKIWRKMRPIGLALKIINHRPVSSDIISSSKAALFHFMDIIKDFGGGGGVGRSPSVLTRTAMDVFAKADRMDGQL